MHELSEEILSAWLQISMSVNNSRIISDITYDMTYNESLICNILYNHYKNNKKELLTATDLCNKTKILKSQMNRTLNNLEKHSFITKQRSTKDKRNVYIIMTPEQAKRYEEQHKKILHVLDELCEQLGTKDTNEAIRLFKSISMIVDNIVLKYNNKDSNM